MVLGLPFADTVLLDWGNRLPLATGTRWALGTTAPRVGTNGRQTEPISGRRRRRRWASGESSCLVLLAPPPLLLRSASSLDSSLLKHKLDPCLSIYFFNRNSVNTLVQTDPRFKVWNLIDRTSWNWVLDGIVFVHYVIKNVDFFWLYSLSIKLLDP